MRKLDLKSDAEWDDELERDCIARRSEGGIWAQ
jgi:hypothetical protein